ncbi:hypothetical protein HII31_04110 [Pseudocercospora fuligena]|uniref:Uncharacterized protein n=1 Tax=Pseudocercospora fuligena TaxID=685502 RepID=A0A8H6RNE1_9PEZI|nr:hypothetical protein HII31_04110 [Pseudocercospora fuligena]
MANHKARHAAQGGSEKKKRAKTVRIEVSTLTALLHQPLWQLHRARTTVAMASHLPGRVQDLKPGAPISAVLSASHGAKHLIRLATAVLITTELATLEKSTSSERCLRDEQQVAPYASPFPSLYGCHARPIATNVVSPQPSIESNHGSVTPSASHLMRVTPRLATSLPAQRQTTVMLAPQPWRVTSE